MPERGSLTPAERLALDRLIEDQAYRDRLVRERGKLFRRIAAGTALISALCVVAGSLIELARLF